MYYYQKAPQEVQSIGDRLAYKYNKKYEDCENISVHMAIKVAVIEAYQQGSVDCRENIVNKVRASAFGNWEQEDFYRDKIVNEILKGEQQ